MQCAHRTSRGRWAPSVKDRKLRFRTTNPRAVSYGHIGSELSLARSPQLFRVRTERDHGRSLPDISADLAASALPMRWSQALTGSPQVRGTPGLKLRKLRLRPFTMSE